jgi:diadenosine tetraphosphatase ApaH/serine/threonine PP2A family protein phosphatase
MRYLVLSDIHGNIEALDAALGAATSLGFDRALVLGDLVGYGADPGSVIDRVRALDPIATVRGNHDKAVAGLCDIAYFNDLAQQAVRWTRAALSAEHMAYLAALPRGPVDVDDQVAICHGSPHDEDAYVFGAHDASCALDACRKPVCFCGHTHVPCFVSRQHGRLLWDELCDGERLTLADGVAYLVNAGSVGQPRDGDPRAAFAIFDTAARLLTFRRVDYPVAAAQNQIIRAGLPVQLALRLAAGR